MVPYIDGNKNPNSSIGSPSFSPLPSFNMIYRMMAKVFRQEGDLKYEYNPFRNMIAESNGALTDFRVKDFGFNLNNPVEMTIQPSYDGTVNVILNDDKNPPRLINSRFTPREDMRYTIVDRRGNNDTNIYKEVYIKQQTSLFKSSEKIPYITYEGLQEGGALSVGNYTFYLKYVDADGNESDVIAESGIISCHIGKINDPHSIQGGLEDEDSGKIIKFKVKNVDSAYDYLNVYFSRTTGSYSKEPVVRYFKLLNKKSILNQNEVEIVITGLDAIQEISIEELNIVYNIVDKVKTQTQVQNMLFLGNVDKPTIPYKELEDLALRVYPTLSNTKSVGSLDHNYKPKYSKTDIDGYEYYDTKNIYYKTGYWDKEIYRFGIVFIMPDDSITPVFNVRGKNNLRYVNPSTSSLSGKIANHYTYKPLYQNGKRSYIEVDDDGYIIDSSKDLENARGVVKIDFDQPVVTENDTFPIGIDFNIEDEVINEIKKYCKGFFFVRQKRIPTTLVQGITIGVDNVSNTPTLRAKMVDEAGNDYTGYFTESFIDSSRVLTHDFGPRLINSTNSKVAAILSPEALLKAEYYNNEFTGTNFNISPASFAPVENYFINDVENPRHFYIKDYKDAINAKNSITSDVKLTLIEDGQPLRYSGSKRFSSRAGIPEEAWRVSFFNREDKSATSKHLIRGMFTGFIGMEGYNSPTSIVNIHIPGYNVSNMKDYFNVRANSSDSFFAISDRYDLKVYDEGSIINYDSLKQNSNHSVFSVYRGDCFINTVTVRMQRNFQDPDVPLSDIIVDPYSWSNNYKGFVDSTTDSSELPKINRNDVNAVQIGHWATFKVCSTLNLAMRSVDTSNSAEYALNGKYRSFFPLASMSTKGESKIPESIVFNAGYNISLGNKLYYGLPNVPYIKNIFDNRIMFSDMHVTDAFRNGYRVFQGMSYKDVTKQYGAIVKIFNLAENLLVVFERGVGIFAINREALFAGGESGEIFTKGLGVLSEKPQKILSDIYGSSWQESIVRTENWIYGVDTIAKKIWRTNGQQFESISDFRVQKFLNDNIVLSEDDKKPMIGLKNVKTHYNAHKKDVIFTFYDSTRDDEEHTWSLCFNEITNKFITRYSWMPLASESVGNVWFSFDRESAKNISLPGYSNYNNEESFGITVKGKTETFTKNGTTRTITNGINIINESSHSVGILAMKGYDYYDNYDLVYSLRPNKDWNDNQYFVINNGHLVWSGVTEFPKYAYKLELKVELYSGGIKHSEWNDIIGVKVSRDYIWANKSVADLEAYDLEFSTWFWKHGQAGIFDISTEILPTKWYDKQEVFEFEFVVANGPETHKMFDNLKILSNNAEPDSFTFEVTSDAYHIPNKNNASYTDVNGNKYTIVTDDYIKTYQKGIDIKKTSRRQGNMSYIENLWDVEIKPHLFKNGNTVKSARIRDKYCIIRVRYSGTKLALITALITLYTQSYS